MDQHTANILKECVRLSKAAAEWSELVLAGKPGAKELVGKLLQPVLD